MESSVVDSNIESVAEANAITDAQVQSWFFGRLCYDVRAIVYEYMNDLPPLSPGGDYKGFILSCRLAKQEIEDVSCSRVEQYLQFFRAMVKEALGCRIKVTALPRPSTLEDLGYISFLFPYPFNTESKKVYNAALWTTVYPTLTKSFKKVNINFALQAGTQLDPVVAGRELDLFLCKDLIRRRYENIALGFDSFTHGNPLVLLDYHTARKEAVAMSERAVHKWGYAGDLQKPIGVKDISFSWDFRPLDEQDADITLHGTCYHTGSIKAFMYEARDVSNQVGEAGFFPKDVWSYAEYIRKDDASKYDGSRVFNRLGSGKSWEWSPCYMDRVGGEVRYGSWEDRKSFSNCQPSDA
ncbi:hypothetical protein K491DRAFT_683578 [Lophiostoma macrostomum CBS 122681]|uniref:Uncharacterized protein n=1 Tax=Lophiostoma macrostomum CBS 122681 TaxID=1314788 RepID=A0A6A6SRU2_9PLEO|nr:hypothetical protein K491DRAFT_683578 [Lophiostoma macrostomum CBS 122681]